MFGEIPFPSTYYAENPAIRTSWLSVYTTLSRTLPIPEMHKLHFFQYMFKTQHLLNLKSQLSLAQYLQNA